MLEALFSPKSIAVIGASNRPLTIGYRITQNLKDIGFKGPIYPVHPKDPEINGLKAYPSILAVPGEVDLAHIVVKNTMVPAIMEECGQKRVKAVIINTAGFKEIGPEGLALEKQVVDIGRKYSILVFGPNCQGIINTDEDNPVYANFTFTRVKPGFISILAQSGGVGEVINQRLAELGAGIRMYASNGNAADVSMTDILQYWADDYKTKVIVLHIESLANPREFIQIARQITKNKPVLGMKTGRTELGARAVVSHTGSMMKADTVMEVIFQKAGVVSFSNQEDLCQAALLFASQPVPQGRNVGIITNTGGPGIITTDECIDAGLQVPELSTQSKEALTGKLPPEASIRNPVDVLATAGPEQYGLAIGALLNDPTIDSVIVNFITPFFVDCEAVAQEIKKLADTAFKPLLAVVMTDKKQWAGTLDILKSGNVPVYDLPETAAKALAALTKYNQYKTPTAATKANLGTNWKPKITIDPRKYLVADDINRDGTRDIITSALKRERMMLSMGESLAILHNYKIPTARFALVSNPDDILMSSSYEYVKFPMVLKVDSPDIVHKSDQNAVILNITRQEQLVAEVKNLKKLFPPGNRKYLVQEYLKGGREVIIGANFVEGLGHMIMFGLGGILVEVLKDVAFQLPPITEAEARRMIQSIKGYKILEGVRGQIRVDIDRAVDIILRVSQLVYDNPEIKELDLNPVMLFPDAADCKVVDVRIKLG